MQLREIKSELWDINLQFGLYSHSFFPSQFWLFSLQFISQNCKLTIVRNTVKLNKLTILTFFLAILTSWIPPSELQKKSEYKLSIVRQSRIVRYKFAILTFFAILFFLQLFFFCKWEFKSHNSDFITHNYEFIQWFSTGGGERSEGGRKLFSRKNRDQALFGYWMYFIAFHFSCRTYMEKSHSAWKKTHSAWKKKTRSSSSAFSCRWGLAEFISLPFMQLSVQTRFRTSVISSGTDFGKKFMDKFIVRKGVVTT